MGRYRLSYRGVPQIEIDTKKVKENYDKAKELKEKIGKPPPAGLIPVGTSGLYRTPDVVDPRDCENYPDSPYCGGNPLTKEPVNLEPDFGFDGCSVHVSVTPTLLFTKLPTQTIAYVRPECRKEYEEQSREPPIPDPPDFTNDDPPKKGYRPTGFDDDDQVVAVFVGQYKSEDQRFNTITQEWDYIKVIASADYERADHPGLVVSSYNSTHQPREALCQVKGKFSTESIATPYWFGTDDVFTSSYEANAFLAIPFDQPNADEKRYTVSNLSGYQQFADTYHGQYKAIEYGDQSGVWSYLNIYIGKFGDIFPSVEMPYIHQTYNNPQDRGYMYYAQQLAFCEQVSKEPPKAPRIPPDDNDRKKCCMSCCNPSQQQQNQNDQLLRQILKECKEINKKAGKYPFSVTLFDADDEKQGAQKRNVVVEDAAKTLKLVIERIEEIEKTLGIDQFPIYVPSSIVEDESHGLFGDLGNLKNKIFKQKIESVAELLTWKIANDNEIHGKWQEFIEIEDSDPTKPGSQKKRIVLPNMARSFRELILLNSVQIKAIGFIMDAVLKMYIDVANTKVASAATEAIVRDIQQFLDYPTTEKNLDVPLGIRIPSKGDHPDDQEDIKRFLSNSHVKAHYDDWTGEGSLHDMLVVLLDAASMIRAQMYGRA